MFDAILLFGLIVTCIDLFLILFLFLHRPHSLYKKICAVLILTIFLWGIIHILAEFLNAPHQLLFLAKISLISVLFTPSIFLFLFFIFPYRLVQHKTWPLLVFLPPLCMLPFSFGELNVIGFAAGLPATYQNIELGSLYNVYITYVIATIVASIVVLAYRIKKETEPVYKQQLIYVFFGFTAFAIFGIINNAILPLWFKVYTDPMNAVLASLLFSLPTTYAMVRKRLFDIRMSVHRRFVNTVILFILIFLSAIGISFLAQYTMDHPVVFIIITTTLGICIALACRHVMYRFVKEEFVRLYTLTAEEKRWLEKSENPKKWGKKMIAAIKAELPISHISLVYYEHGSIVFKMGYPYSDQRKFSIKEEWILALTEKPQLLNVNHLNEQHFSDQQYKELKQISESLKAEYIIPLKPHHRLLGVLFIGKKKKRKEYTSSDIATLLEIQEKSGMTLWHILQLHYTVQESVRLGKKQALGKI